MRLFGSVDGLIDSSDVPHFYGLPFDRTWFPYSFPTLSRSPNYRAFADELTGDPTLRAEFENGRKLTRSRFTAVKRKFSVQYNYLTVADADLLRTLEDNVKVGSEQFRWTHPKTSVQYDVRLTGPIKYKMEPRERDLWQAILEVEQI